MGTAFCLRNHCVDDATLRRLLPSLEEKIRSDDRQQFWEWLFHALPSKSTANPSSKRRMLPAQEVATVLESAAPFLGAEALLNLLVSFLNRTAAQSVSSDSYKMLPVFLQRYATEESLENY